ncbi:MAG TPA: hypothetical protein VJN20_02345 [Burkholderiales bacterium]|nr:hypothetical protein [Burkholderiales bacterium]
MDIIDRSIIPDLQAAARRHRAAYLGCLFASFRTRLSGLLYAGSRRTIAWG